MNRLKISVGFLLASTFLLFALSRLVSANPFAPHTTGTANGSSIRDNAMPSVNESVTGVAAEERSSTLMVKTHAPAFKIGASFPGQSNGDGSLAPAAVPEPGFYGIMAFGLAITLLAVRFRRKPVARP